METTVMIGEKPKVASRLANALGNYSIKENRGVKNYEIETDDRKIIIAPAVGHIFNLDQVEDGWDYPVFDVEWKPIFETSDSSDYVKKYYNNLKDQIEKADSYINACDFDLEGCLHEEEKVIIKKNGEILTCEAGELIDSIIKDGNIQTDGEFEYIQDPNIEILGSENWNTEFQNVEKVMRRPSNDTYFQITVFNGRKIKVSPNHPLLIATENGLETRKAEEVEEGDKLFATKQIPDNEAKEELDLTEELDEYYVHGFKEEMDIMPAEMCKHVNKTRKQCLNYRYNDRMPKKIFLELEEYLGVDRENLTVSSHKGTTELPAKLKLDKELGRIIGLYLAEGCIDSGGFIGFYFGPEEDNLVKEVQDFLKRIGTKGKTRRREVEGSYGNSKCFEVGTKSRIFRELLEHLEIGDSSGSKRLPAWMLSAPDRFKEGLISGYWDGDGSLFIDQNDDRAIASAGSKSRDLLEEIFYLLQTNGINPSFQVWDHSQREMTNLTIGRKHDVKKLADITSAKAEFLETLNSINSSSKYDRLNSVPVELAQRQKIRSVLERKFESMESVSNKHISQWESEMSNYPSGDTTFLQVKKIEEKKTDNSDYFYDFQTESRNYQHGQGIISHNSVIGYSILHNIADAPEERIERMKFSTLTPDDLQEAFDNLEDFDKGMTEAGVTRHILDYYYGINVSRALMKAVRDNDRYKTLSTGRVQGPTLKILADREREIKAFEPDPYWELYLIHSEFEAQWEDDEDRIWDEESADEVFNDVYGETEAEVTNIKVNNYSHNPPIPFNLTGLQSEASSQFNISPKQTQSIAQTLYENGLISYPRTESQKLPPKLGYKTLLKKLKGQEKYTEKAKKVLKKDENDNLYTTQGKKEDDAHPAIYPTGESPSSLSKQEGRIYDLVVKRFFAVFGKAAKRQSLTFTLDVNDHEFKAKSKITKERNWYDLYDPYVRVDEAELPEMEEGQILEVEDFRKDEKETQPPNRYSQSGIVNQLEKQDLGTKATRAQTVDRLYNRNYIEDKPIQVTDLGLAIIDTLEDYCSDVISEELTREFEAKMEEIREGNNTREEVLGEARDELGDILGKFKENQKKIGAELVNTIDAERERRRTLGECQECEDGMLRMIKSNGSKFVGCSNYPDCENTYPLPNNGNIEPKGSTCDECGTPEIKVTRNKGKNYEMCIFPDCKTKEDW